MKEMTVTVKSRYGHANVPQRIKEEILDITESAADWHRLSKAFPAQFAQQEDGYDIIITLRPNGKIITKAEEAKS